ncbi:MAG: trypsin-like peptidase domain-containing protein [Nitrospirae bacterium]|nr:trypsin-like peptidase domain-containing protein [Nitrospirota bacterium]
MYETTFNDHRGFTAERFSRVIPFPLFLCLMIMVMFFFHTAFSHAEKSSIEHHRLQSTISTSFKATPVKLGVDEQETISIFERATKSVVFITNTAIRRDYWTLNTFEVPQGSGSGIIWDRQGHIVTNFHVVYGANSIEVILSDQSSYQAQVVGVDPDHDLAVLRIKNTKDPLMPIDIGNSQGLRVGQKVLAIGNPFGLDHTLTTGIVSALGRSIQSMNERTIEDVIQTDAAINPGNSGGPLLDSEGRLIGINTQIVSPSGAYAGIGFAVPVNTITRVIPQLISFGKLIRPGIGISLIPDSIAARWGIQGLIIAKIEPGSPADKAGLESAKETRLGRIQLGDIITKIDEEPVKIFDDLLKIFDRHKVGDRIAVEVHRNGKYRKVSVKLKAID